MESPLFLTDLHTAHEPTGCSLRDNQQSIASEITSNGKWFSLSWGPGGEGWGEGEPLPPYSSLLELRFMGREEGKDC
jgi:hypothetical protein